MAAGLGFKNFQTGEVLTSADVNGYLMQGVLVFASEAARDAAITSPQEGQFAYTKDNNSLWYYSGSAWVASGATGDIEGVTAGTGISGGGTSGTVTITNSMATAIDAKGDLIVGTGADTFSRLAVGTNGQVLTADSTEATGLKFAAPASGGGMTSLVSANLPTNTNTVTLSTISADYIDLVLYIRDFYFAADDYLTLRVNGATGATDYGFININQSAENTAAIGCDGLRDRLYLTGDDGNESADRNAFAMLQIPDYANTSHIKALYSRSVVRDQTNTYNTQALSWGNFNSASAISSITLLTQNGSNFSGGSYQLYGVK